MKRYWITCKFETIAVCRICKRQWKYPKENLYFMRQYHANRIKWFFTFFSVAPDCECSTWGIQHYMTFDGQLIHFMGGCKYNLVTSKNTKLADFAVEIKNDLRGKTQMFSYRLVDIRINGATIILWPSNKLSVSKINNCFR